MKKNVIIIGGVAGGTSAAASAKRLNPELDIKIFEAKKNISVGSCSFPYYIGGLIDDPKKLYYFTPNTFFNKKGVEVFTEHLVTEINLNKRCVLVKNLKNNSFFEENFDVLVIATGAKPIQLKVPGRELNGIFNLKFFDDVIQIKEYMNNNLIKKVGIIGGGNIGLELVENFSRLGITPVVIEKLPQPAATYDTEIIDSILKELNHKGIEIITDTTAQEYLGSEGKVSAVKTDNGVFEVDMVVETIGIRPNSEIYKDLGLKMLPNGALFTNSKSQAEGYSNIYAAGDCAGVKNLITGKMDYFPLGTTANKQGRTAGNNIGGVLDTYKGTAKAQVFKLFDLEIGKTGLTEAESKSSGFETIAITLDLKNKSSVFEKSGTIRIKLIGDKNTHRILGCSMIGIEGVTKRLDLFTSLITYKIPLEDAKYLDLNYSPPFSTVWDISAIAIQKLITKM